MTQIIKPYGKSWNEGWEWDGKIFKAFGKSWNEGWEWDGKIFKPYGKSWNEGWEVSANIPIQVIAFACIFATEDSLDSVSNDIVAKLPKENTNLEKSKIKKTSNRKRPQSISTGAELGERLADFTFDLIGRIIGKIISYLKK